MGAGGAVFAAEVDEEVGEGDPFGFGDELHEVLFDFYWVGLGGEAEFAGEAHDVGVDGDAFGFVVGAGEDDVGGFAGDTGEGVEFFHSVGDFVLVFFVDYFG